MKQLNHMGAGMHPLNHASKLSKVATDIMFSVAVNDDLSALSRLDQLQQVADELRKAIGNAEDIAD